MPITTTSGFAIDGRAECPRVFPAGQEKATEKNGDLARNTGDLANAVDRGK